jgi:hypothetical protein
MQSLYILNFLPPPPSKLVQKILINFPMTSSHPITSKTTENRNGNEN